MPLEIFMILLLISSILTSLITEAAKKLVYDFASNAIVAVIAVVVGGVTGITYCYTLPNLPGTLTIFGIVFGLVIGSWLCAMLGYDKIKQAVLQFKTLSIGGSDTSTKAEDD